MPDPAALRGPSSRIYRVIVLIGLVCIFVLVGLSHHSETHPSIRYDRRSDYFLVHREDNLTSTNAITTNTPLSSIPISSPPVSAPVQPARSSSTSSGISTSQSSVPLSRHSSSSSFSPSSSTVTLSSTSQPSRSAQSSISSTSNVLRLSFARTDPSTLPPFQSAATTLAFTDFSAPTVLTSIISTTSSGETGPTDVSSALNSSTFWQKKGAVAATFAIITFVVVAISAILVVTYLKRRNVKKQQQIHEDLFEKYSEEDHRSNSPGSSINAAPLNAFARRDVRHDSGAPFESYQATPTPRNLQSSSPVQHPDYYNQPPSRYLAPSQAQSLGRKPAPTSFREPISRQTARDSYQPSIDSFYGGAGQPSA